MVTDNRRERALAELPTAYAVALRMRDDGRNDAEIASALGVDPVAVGPLLRVAEAKLAAVLEEGQA